MVDEIGTTTSQPYRHERPPSRHFDRNESVLIPAEIGDSLELRRAPQLATKVVSPTMVAAAELRCLTAGARQDRGGTMPANVEKSAEDSLSVAQHDDRETCHVERHELTRLGDLVRTSHDAPLRGEDPVSLQLINLWIAIPSCRYGPGLFKRQAWIKFGFQSCDSIVGSSHNRQRFRMRPTTHALHLLLRLNLGSCTNRFQDRSEADFGARETGEVQYSERNRSIREVLAVLFHLVLLAIWLMIAVPLLIVNLTGRELFGLAPGQPGLTMGIVAGLLAIYNLARFYAGRTTRKTKTTKDPVKKKPIPSSEYLPEFDFTRQEGDSNRSR